MNAPDSPFLPHGGYRKLRSYKVVQAVYDATVVFCRRFFPHDRRMSDQMVQAARSGLRVRPKDSREALAMRARLAQDRAPNLPPATAGGVRLKGLAGLSEFAEK